MQELFIEINHLSGVLKEIGKLCLEGLGRFEEMLQDDGKEFELVFVGIFPEISF